MLTNNQPDSVNKTLKQFYFIIGILLLGTLLIVLKRFMEPEMGRDSSFYLILVKKWSNSGLTGVLEFWPAFWIPPLFLYLANVLTYTGLSPETAALVICMGCGILMPLISFAIANEICHNHTGSIGYSEPEYPCCRLPFFRFRLSWYQIRHCPRQSAMGCFI